MTILGIDPGYGTVGYGVVRYENFKFTPVQYGAVTTKAGMPMHLRLCEIYDDIGTLVDTFHPDEVAIEELFFSKNITTGIQVAQARGVILLALAQKGLHPISYTPNQVKMAVVGYGGAEKRQMMELTRNILHLTRLPRPDDAADALALAICHAHSRHAIRFED
ncbi:MAG: crossover junction endodeoxyribonuclease RuvC [Agathobaculum sp.]|uniref:crossover junction endodeoxyribonuclease RuvC n=1 Tax=Agathobaculum sp. TaxID=2048138 RepID=UPI0025BBE341|nr:crossover junction endodeoxyribonuclease RuvC [Agathobaculum sp.]MCI7126129.1 crossover junction endodeoxyribonuclease RuvC [Agathobaculum sp.]MDY3711936.1 crossover junction endodeoxyribonuclease RuvC [Agathobaculum sp.]